MKVTIITITYNSTHIIDKHINGLKLAGRDFEWIVIDNASRDYKTLTEKLSAAKNDAFFNDIKLISNPNNVFFTKAANQGIKMASGELILIMNPDCYAIDENWLVKMIDEWTELKPDIAGFKLVRDDFITIEHVGAHYPGVHEGKGEQDKGQYNKAKLLTDAKQYVTGACLMMSKTTIEKFGLLDERHIHYCSDRKYCFNIRDNGGSVWYLPVRMVHLFGRSTH